MRPGSDGIFGTEDDELWLNGPDGMPGTEDDIKYVHRNSSGGGWIWRPIGRKRSRISLL